MAFTPFANSTDLGGTDPWPVTYLQGKLVRTKEIGTVLTPQSPHFLFMLSNLD